MKKFFILLASVALLDASAQTKKTKTSSPSTSSSPRVETRSSSTSSSSSNSSTSDMGFSKGNIIVSGTINLGSTSASGGGASTTSIKFLPSAGIFVTDNILASATAGISTKDAQFGGADVFKFGGDGTYYFTPSSQFSFIAGAGLMVNVASGGGGTSFTIAGAPGISYFLHPRWNLRASLGSVGGTFGDGGSNINLGIDLSQANFGVLFKIK